MDRLQASYDELQKRHRKFAAAVIRSDESGASQAELELDALRESMGIPQAILIEVTNRSRPQQNDPRNTSYPGGHLSGRPPIMWQ